MIPATMATQHPDNAGPPYWERDSDGFVSTGEEIEECLSAFRDLGCQEFMWDWEGKHVDEAVVDKLFHAHLAFFKKRQLGRDVFLTFRIPNIWHERGYSLARAMMGIHTAESFARDLGLHTPPLFEVILPMTKTASDIITIQRTFSRLSRFTSKLFREPCHFHYLSVLPLLEGVDDLLSAPRLLERYLILHRREFGKKPSALRLHIARSDPALNAGLVPAVVAGKVALHHFYQFGRRHGIDIHPALGAGTLPFRGGLSPLRINDFVREYGGVRTVYIQSAFRYDFPLPAVKRAIARLNRELPRTEPPHFSSTEIATAAQICHQFTAPYRRTVETIAPMVNRIAQHVPSRRERKLHIGLFGYSRTLGKVRLPRAIPFTAALYSLGVPPELIGTGRGLRLSERSGSGVETYYRNIRRDLVLAGRYLNKDNLARLGTLHRGWRAIADDVHAIESFLGAKLGPKTRADEVHRTLTTDVLRNWSAGAEVADLIIQSGKIRHSLG